MLERMTSGYYGTQTKKSNMKKFQFAAGFAALALMASCSSDAPDSPVTPAGEEGGMYISLKLAAPAATRAVDVNAKDGESTIMSAKLYMYAGDTKIFEGTAKEVDDELKAYFQVNQVVYDYLKSVQEDGTEVALTVVANATPDDALATLKTGTTTAEIDSKANGFIMTNNTPCKGKLAKVVTTKIGDKEEVWQINDGGTGVAAAVELVRLASRFDFEAYSGSEKNYVTAGGAEITIEGMDVVYANETSTYWFEQEGFRTPNWNATYNNNVTIANLFTEDNTKAKWYRYGRPHAYDFTSNSDAAVDYTTVPFLIVKASFTSDLESMTKENKQTVYAFNGYLLGSIDEIIKADATKIDADYTNVKSFVEGIQQLNQLRGNVADADLVRMGAKKFTPDSDGNYYTYYSKTFNKADKNAGNTAAYAIKRNTVYKFSVKSFGLLGLQGDETPQDFEKTELKDMWFDVVMTIKDWELNDKNTGLKF